MGLQSDLILFSGLLIIFSGIAFAAGVIDFPGTGEIRLPDDGDQQKTYALETSIDVRGKIIDAELDKESFSYDTSECGVINCGGLSFTETPLFAFGADNVEVTVALYNSQGQKVGEANKYLGDVEFTQTEAVDQRFTNIPAGDYTVEYILDGQASYGDVRYEQSFNIQVPETIAEGGAT